MAYATVDDVQAQDTGRQFNAQSKPTSSQVAGYLDHTAAELDGILRGRGYSLPIATTATSALALLEHGNTLGAAAMVAQGASTGGKGDTAAKLWESFKKALMSGALELDASKDTTSGLVRTNSVASAFFARADLH